MLPYMEQKTTIGAGRLVLRKEEIPLSLKIRPKLDEKNSFR